MFNLLFAFLSRAHCGGFLVEVAVPKYVVAWKVAEGHGPVDASQQYGSKLMAPNLSKFHFHANKHTKATTSIVCMGPI